MASRFGHISIKVLDKLGVTVAMPVYFNADDTKTLALILGEAGAMVGDVDGLTDGVITSASINIQVPLPGGIKTAPNTTAEVERTGLFNLSQSGSPYKYGVDVPAIKESLLLNGKIVLTDPLITAFIGLLTTAGASLTYVSQAIHPLLALVDALLTFRKHRKPESRRSFEVAP